MLDSSTVASPHVRKSLKRSASTASLPTPPRTYRKHLRGKSKGSCDSEDLASSSDLEGVSEPHKKRRLDSGDEDAFWLNGRSEPAGSNSKTSGATMSKLQTAPWLYRKRNGQTSQVDSAPVSPPPSYRKTKTRFRTPKISPTSEGKSPPVTSPPSTPRRYMTRSAFRDSPDNPFLATPVKNESSPPSDSADPSPGTPSYDKPYITYVLYVHLVHFSSFLLIFPLQPRHSTNLSESTLRPCPRPASLSTSCL